MPESNIRYDGMLSDSSLHDRRSQLEDLMRKPLLLLGLLVFAAPAWAQSVGIQVGKVLAVDREAHLLVLTDRNVWSMPDSSKGQTHEIAAGDRVEFSYQKVEDGPAVILDIKVTHHASEAGFSEVTEGTVLAFDRSAKLLIMTDKSAWPVGSDKLGLPPGLGAGDRVRIEYKTDEDGHIEVDDLIVIFK